MIVNTIESPVSIILFKVAPLEDPLKLGVQFPVFEDVNKYVDAVCA